jgi:hypothetical protein
MARSGTRYFAFAPPRRGRCFAKSLVRIGGRQRGNASSPSGNPKASASAAVMSAYKFAKLAIVDNVGISAD